MWHGKEHTRNHVLHSRARNDDKIGVVLINRSTDASISRSHVPYPRFRIRRRRRWSPSNRRCRRCVDVVLPEDNEEDARRRVFLPHDPCVTRIQCTRDARQVFRRDMSFIGTVYSFWL